MRCPKYSSDDEEPDYYELYGKEIHHIGRLTHLEKLGMGDANELSELKAKVDPAALKDYLDRRTFNGNFNIRTLDLVEDGTIEFSHHPAGRFRKVRLHRKWTRRPCARRSMRRCSMTV